MIRVFKNHMLMASLGVSIFFTILFANPFPLSASPGSDVSDIPVKQTSSVLFDEWYEILMDGTKVGYMNQLVTQRFFDGHEVINVRQTVKTIFLRDGHPLESSTITETISDVKTMKPVGYTQVSMDGNDRRVSTGRSVDEIHFDFESKIGGKVTTRELNIENGIVFSTILDLLARRNLHNGFKKECSAIMEGDGDIADATISVSNNLSKPPCDGASYVTHTIVAGLESIEWRDKTGQPLCIIVPSMRGMFKLAGKESAIEPVKPADIFKNSLIVPDRLIKQTEKLKSMTIKIISPDKPHKLPEDWRQKIISSDKTSVTIKTVAIKETDKIKMPVSLKGMEKYLAPTDFEQSTSSSITSIARELASPQDDALSASKKIIEWVNGYIRRPSSKRGYLSALEVLETKEGDCTEYAILVSSIAKATGLPSRLAAGISYLEGYFGYHIWNEIWVGYWQPFDASSERYFINPAYIKIWNGIGDSGGLRDASIAVLNAFDGAKIKIIDTEYME